MIVKTTEDIIEEGDPGPRVDCPCKRLTDVSNSRASSPGTTYDTLLLASTQSKTFATDERMIAVREHGKILFKIAGYQYLSVEAFIEF